MKLTSTLTCKLEYPVLIDDARAGREVSMDQSMGVQMCKSLSGIICKREPEQPAKFQVWVEQDIVETTSEAVLMHDSSDGATLNNAANERTNILVLDLPETDHVHVNRQHMYMVAH